VRLAKSHNYTVPRHWGRERLPSESRANLSAPHSANQQVLKACQLRPHGLTELIVRKDPAKANNGQNIAKVQSGPAPLTKVDFRAWGPPPCQRRPGRRSISTASRWISPSRKVRSSLPRLQERRKRTSRASSRKPCRRTSVRSFTWACGPPLGRRNNVHVLSAICRFIWTTGW